jgi:hypothetical protein
VLKGAVTLRKPDEEEATDKKLAPLVERPRTPVATLKAPDTKGLSGDGRPVHAQLK